MQVVTWATGLSLRIERTRLSEYSGIASTVGWHRVFSRCESLGCHEPNVGMSKSLGPAACAKEVFLCTNMHACARAFVGVCLRVLFFYDFCSLRARDCSTTDDWTLSSNASTHHNAVRADNSGRKLGTGPTPTPSDTSDLASSLLAEAQCTSPAVARGRRRDFAHGQSTSLASQTRCKGSLLEPIERSEDTWRPLLFQGRFLGLAWLASQARPRRGWARSHRAQPGPPRALPVPLRRRDQCGEKGTILHDSDKKFLRSWNGVRGVWS